MRHEGKVTMKADGIVGGERGHKFTLEMKVIIFPLLSPKK
jgi:hypothetical protein